MWRRYFLFPERVDIFDSVHVFWDRCGGCKGVNLDQKRVHLLGGLAILCEIFAREFANDLDGRLRLSKGSE